MLLAYAQYGMLGENLSLSDQMVVLLCHASLSIDQYLISFACIVLTAWQQHPITPCNALYGWPHKIKYSILRNLFLIYSRVTNMYYSHYNNIIAQEKDCKVPADIFILLQNRYR